MTPERSSRVLAAVLATAGVLHFVKPGFFDAIVPKALPGSPRSWTYVSGVAELAVAGAVVQPSTRRFGGLAAAVLFVAVLPANVQAAVDARTPVEKAITWGRVPLQVPLIRWALKVREKA